MASVEKNLSLADFTTAKLTQLGQLAWAKKKKEIHAKGVPTTKFIDDKIYYEYPNGDLVLLKDLSKASDGCDNPQGQL